MFDKKKCINVKPVSIHMLEKYRMIYLASKRNACFRKIITHVNALAPLQGKAKQYFKLLFTIHQQVIFCTPNWNICYTSILVFHIHYQVVIRNTFFNLMGYIKNIPDNNYFDTNNNVLRNYLIVMRKSP